MNKTFFEPFLKYLFPLDAIGVAYGKAPTPFLPCRESFVAAELFSVGSWKLYQVRHHPDLEENQYVVPYGVWFDGRASTTKVSRPRR